MGSVTLDRVVAVGSDADGGASADAARLFALMWAAAVLFHIVSAPMRFEAYPQPSPLGVTMLALGLTAVAVLARPRDVRLLLVLAVLQLVSVWLEAPLLGNHWVVAGFVSLALLVAAASVWRRDRRVELSTVFERFAPAARWVLLSFYAMAALSKLNTGFLDPLTSCATFFFGESLGVFGLDPLAGGDRSWLAYAVIGGTVATELSVPVLLVVRRTRHIGVLVGVSFHALLAMDLAHPFFDFSSLLFALFVLFLPPAFATWLAAVRGEPSRRRGRVVVAAAAVLLVLAAGPRVVPLAAVVLLSSYLAWFVYAAVCVLAVARYVLRHRAVAARGALATGSVALAVVPVLVVLNGLTPWVEAKTAFGYTMYSNLVTVAGESNHLIVPATLPVTDVQRDLVEIRASSDPDLQWYADHGYALPWLTLRAYLEDRPGASLEYVRDGRVQTLGPGGDVAAVAPVPVWQEKLMAFRAVDLEESPRCQDRWGAAN